MPEAIIAILVLLVLAILLIVANIKIVPQSKAYVVERLGTFHSTWETGSLKRLQKSFL